MSHIISNVQRLLGKCVGAFIRVPELIPLLLDGVAISRPTLKSVVQSISITLKIGLLLKPLPQRCARSYPLDKATFEGVTPAAVPLELEFVRLIRVLDPFSKFSLRLRLFEIYPKGAVDPEEWQRPYARFSGSTINLSNHDRIDHG